MPATRHEITRSSPWRGELAASSVAEQPHDGELSLLLAVESVKRVRTEAGERALRQALAESRPQHTIRVSGQALVSVSVSPDGHEFATGGADGIVRLFDLPTGKRITRFVNERSKSLDTVVFSPDGSRLLIVAGGTARLLEVRRGDDERVPLHPSLVLDQDPAAAVRGNFSPDGTRVVTADEEGGARVWDAVRGGAPLAVLAAGPRLTDAEFSSDGTRVVTTSRDGSTLVFDADHGGEPLVEMDSPTTEAWVRAVWTANDSWIVVGGTKGSTYFDANTGARLASDTGSVADVAASRSGDGIAVGKFDGTVDVRDPSSKVARSLRANGGVVTGVAFTPNGRRVVTASADGAVRVWGLDPLVPGARDSSVDDLAVSRDGRRALVITGADQQLTLYRVTAHGLRATCQIPLGGTLAAAAFSPDAKLVVTGVDDGTVRAFRVADGEEVGRTAQPGQPVGTVAFSPNGTRILATFAEGDDMPDRVLVYDWPRLGDQPLEIVDGQANDEAYFAPGGRQVLTMGNDGVAADVVVGPPGEADAAVHQRERFQRLARRVQHRRSPRRGHRLRHHRDGVGSRSPTGTVDDAPAVTGSELGRGVQPGRYKDRDHE